METAAPPVIGAPRVPLSRARIVDAALLLIDTEGLEALSMRKLGAALGVEAMSLYNHVRNKDDLLGAISDHLSTEVLAEFERTADAAATWQDRARAMAHAYWNLARARPRAFALVSERPIDSMNGMQMLARCLEIFTDAGLSFADATTAFHVSASWMMGTIAQELGLLHKLAEAGGLGVTDVPESLVRIVDFRDACIAQSPEARFADGLEIVLAGIETRLAVARPHP